MISQYVPEGYTFDFEEYLFSSEKHRKTQSDNNWHSFYLLNEKRYKIVASWHLHVLDGIVESPYRGTFGGFSFSSKLSVRKLSSFIYDVVHLLADKSIEQWKVILPPQIYHEQKFIKSYQVLSDNKFVPTTSEVGASIIIDDQPFGDIIHKSEFKKLKRSKKEGLIFCVEKASAYEEIYRLITQCRKERGNELSLSEEQLSVIIDQIPEVFNYYTVRSKDELIAGAICIDISEDIQYVFYGGHLKKFDKISPAVMLYEGIYNSLREKNFKLLDFGTSSLNGITDYNLLDFKQYLGASLSLRITFQKDNG